MLVPKEWLQRVAGMNQTLHGIMTIAAAPLGALALSVFPLQGALMIDVATALLGIVPLLIFAIPQVRTPSSQTNSVLDDFKKAFGTQSVCIPGLYSGQRQAGVCGLRGQVDKK